LLYLALAKTSAGVEMSLDAARKDLAHQTTPQGIQRSLRGEHSNAGAVSWQIEFARL
jgi:hypothetical protein